MGTTGAVWGGIVRFEPAWSCASDERPFADASWSRVSPSAAAIELSDSPGATTWRNAPEALAGARAPRRTTETTTKRSRTAPQLLFGNHEKGNPCNAPVSLQERVQALAAATSDRAGKCSVPSASAYGAASDAIRSLTSVHCSFDSPSLVSANMFERSSWVSM